MVLDFDQIWEMVMKLPVAFAYLGLDPSRNSCTILAANPVFEELVGDKGTDLTGKTIEEVLFDFEGSDFSWAEACRQVNEEGKPLRLERFHEKRDCWYEIALFCGSKDHLAVILQDITDKKKGEYLLRKSERRFRSLVGNMKGGIVVEDEKRNIMLTNQVFCDIFNIPAPPDSLIGSNCSQSADQVKHLLADPDLFPRRIAEIIKKQEVVIGEEIYFTDGQVYERDYIPVFVDGDSFIGHMWQYRDITQRKKAEEKLKESEERYREILDSIEEGYYEVDLKGNFVFFNDSFSRLHGYKPEELQGANYKQFYEDTGEVYAVFNQVYRTGEPEFAFCWPLTTGDGREIIIELSITLRRNDDGKPIGFSGIAKDVTERKLYEENLKYLSMHDQLTGLYNRAFFVEEMNRLNKSREYPITIISTDLDQLKLVNDTRGHSTGDELLKACAAVLSAVLRSSDILARVGGDEFVILLPRTDLEAGERIAERIRSQLRAYNRDNPHLPLSLSLGVATATSTDLDLEEIYKKADKIMLQEKMERRR